LFFFFFVGGRRPRQGLCGLFFLKCILCHP
jgi:hypothetical protein